MSCETHDSSELAKKKCKPCEGGMSPMSDDEIRKNLKVLNHWSYEDGVVAKTFSFKNYYETTAFVNAVVWMAHREDHHPDISFGYKNCRVAYSTHAIDGISENDFICAAKIDALFA
ncbi:MAG: 4a-hydroxytetrahydrobiopterin dehydratase [Candidatus Omnitrophota bacterium]|nr:4a-hydroxytetrahydrobiopterin dehydratase [Candidatus Omnitrophota bacterium]